MARPGRPKKTHSSTRWDLYIDPLLAAEVELVLTDPVRGKAKYGERSKLIETLLRKWLDEQRAEQTHESIGADDTGA